MVSINVCEININIKYIANRRLICDVEYFTFCEQFYLFFFDQYLHSETENYLASKSSF